jgi:hypothetical protein
MGSAFYFLHYCYMHPSCLYRIYSNRKFHFQINFRLKHYTADLDIFARIRLFCFQPLFFFPKYKMINAGNLSRNHTSCFASKYKIFLHCNLM